MTTVKQMIEQILASGIKEGELARMANTTQATINRIRRGKVVDPGYSIGKSIENVLEQLLKETAA